MHDLDIALEFFRECVITVAVPPEQRSSGCHNRTNEWEIGGFLSRSRLHDNYLYDCTDLTKNNP